MNCSSVVAVRGMAARNGGIGFGRSASSKGGLRGCYYYCGGGDGGAALAGRRSSPFSATATRCSSAFSYPVRCYAPPPPPPPPEKEELENKQKGGKISRQEASHIKGFKGSSTRWLKRQFTDPYVKKAQEDSLASRAAFKLEQINEKHKFLTPGKSVLDLGACPGGWSQIAARHVLHDASTESDQSKKGVVLSVDLQPMDNVGSEFLQLDIMDEKALDQVREALRRNGREDGTVDVVLSDMSPKISGSKTTDHLRIMGLTEEALRFGEELLKDGGVFVVKVLQGENLPRFVRRLESRFGKVLSVKPDASRKDSREMYYVAKDFHRAPAPSSAAAPEEQAK